MLVKQTLEISISNAIQKAMKEAYMASTYAVKDCNYNSELMVDRIATVFSDKAKECAKGIADAIDSYIRSATITIPTGTTITSNPALSALTSPAGPVTGALTTLSPIPILNSIS